MHPDTSSWLTLSQDLRNRRGGYHGGRQDVAVVHADTGHVAEGRSPAVGRRRSSGIPPRWEAIGAGRRRGEAAAASTAALNQKLRGGAALPPWPAAGRLRRDAPARPSQASSPGFGAAGWLARSRGRGRCPSSSSAAASQSARRPGLDARQAERRATSSPSFAVEQRRRSCSGRKGQLVARVVPHKVAFRWPRYARSFWRAESSRPLSRCRSDTPSGVGHLPVTESGVGVQHERCPPLRLGVEWREPDRGEGFGRSALSSPARRAPRRASGGRRPPASPAPGTSRLR